MASTDDTAFGASIVPLHQRASPPILVLDSPALTPVGSHEDLPVVHGIAIGPYHAAPSQPQGSHMKAPNVHVRQPSQSSITLNEKHDLEAGIYTPLAVQAGKHDDFNPFSSKISVDHNKECKMWPSRQTLLQNRLADKRRKRDAKGCGWCLGPMVNTWAGFTTRQKLLIKIITAFLFVGIVVAVAVGISIAVKGTVNTNAGQTQIPQPQKRS